MLIRQGALVLRMLLTVVVVATGVMLPMTSIPAATANTAATIENGVDCEKFPRECTIGIGDGGTSGGGADASTGLTPAPASCVLNSGDVSTPIECSRGEGWWSNARQCYLDSLAHLDWSTEINGREGGFYRCVPYDAVCTGPGAGACTLSSIVFLETPPPGIITFSPAQAARQLVRSFTLQPIDIGIAPDSADGSLGHVGLPVWLWVKNSADPLAYGPYNRTETLGGVTITAEARVTSILWDMGDGGSHACANPGTPYTAAFGIADSPTCGYRYERSSSNQAGGRYQITATSQWEVQWSGGGQSGTIPLTTEQNASVEVRELQSVNVGN